MHLTSRAGILAQAAGLIRGLRHESNLGHQGPHLGAGGIFPLIFRETKFMIEKCKKVTFLGLFPLIFQETAVIRKR